jgi:hypothetical protein
MSNICFFIKLIGKLVVFEVPGFSFVSFGQAKERPTPDPEESMQPWRHDEQMNSTNKVDEEWKPRRYDEPNISEQLNCEALLNTFGNITSVNNSNK